jgi:hypothetical protein
MTERQATDEARRRNRELGEAGVTDAFWLEVERSTGMWDVELRHDQPSKRSFWSRLLSILEKGPPLP